MHQSGLKGKAASRGRAYHQVIYYNTALRFSEEKKKGEYILAVENITMQELSVIDTSFIKGLISAYDCNMSHTAILMRSLHIPYVYNVKNLFDHIHEFEFLFLDGDTAHIFKTAPKEYFLSKKSPSGFIPKKILSADEKEITLAATINSIYDAKMASQYTVDGIGLLRTEYLFHNTLYPSIHKQNILYRKILDANRGKLVNFRLFDMAGCKNFSCLNAAQKQELINTQIHALLQIYSSNPISVTFSENTPSLFSLTATRFCTLYKSFHPRCAAVPKCGFMLERADFISDLACILSSADFICIGTNDLCADILHKNRECIRERDFLNPLFLRALKQIARIAYNKIDTIYFCGGMPGFLEGIAVLLSMGFSRFSVELEEIPAISHALSKFNITKARAYLPFVLNAKSSAEALQRIFTFLYDKSSTSPE